MILSVQWNRILLLNYYIYFNFIIYIFKKDLNINLSKYNNIMVKKEFK